MNSIKPLYVFQVDKSSMKVKTLKKNSTQAENTCSSTATDKIPSHLVTDERISGKNIGKESAVRMTNQMREGGLSSFGHSLPRTAATAAAAAFFCRLFFSLYSCF